MKKIIILLVVILIVVAVVSGWWWYSKQKAPTETAMSLVGSASYLCQAGKTIDAKFYQGPAIAVKPGEMPIPNGSVSLKLSDGRSLTLPQTISADGIRYANADESVVFWSKGNGAFVTEANGAQTYSNCVSLAANPGDLPNAYVNKDGTFSIRYPASYTLNDSYLYQALGPGKDIAGIKFTIPDELATGTNLSSFDTGVSVESIPQTIDCNASLFLYQGVTPETVTDSGVTYSVASGSDAGAGNFYEEKVWAMPGTNPCLAIRYFIHSTNISNYPTGTVTAFDHDALVSQFDEIRRSLTIAP